MNIFREVWFNTAKCMDYCISLPENKRSYYYLILLIPAVAEWVDDRDDFASFAVDDTSLFVGAVVFLIASIAITFLAFYFLWPWLIFKFGKLVSQAGLLRDMRFVLTIACLPSVLLVLFYLVEFLIPGNQESRSIVFEVLVWIFSLRILIIGTAKVKKVSYLFAALNISSRHSSSPSYFFSSCIEDCKANINHCTFSLPKSLKSKLRA